MIDRPATESAERPTGKAPCDCSDSRSAETSCGYRVASRLCLLSLWGILFITACSHNRTVPDTVPPPPLRKDGVESKQRHEAPLPHRGSSGIQTENPPTVSQKQDIEERLWKEYRRWQGTRHRLGGNGRNGIDCSGFVQAVYRNVFSIDLPRTTGQQVKRGRPVAFQDIRVGDLVFFTPPDYPRHVGIYLSDGQFAHASKTSGVTVSSIDRYYWKPHFWKARRILAD